MYVCLKIINQFVGHARVQTLTEISVLLSWSTHVFNKLPHLLLRWYLPYHPNLDCRNDISRTYWFWHLADRDSLPASHFLGRKDRLLLFDCQLHATNVNMTLSSLVWFRFHSLDNFRCFLLILIQGEKCYQHKHSRNFFVPSNFLTTFKMKSPHLHTTCKFYFFLGKDRTNKFWEFPKEFHRHSISY